jgi:hypothetical protein
MNSTRSLRVRLPFDNRTYFQFMKRQSLKRWARRHVDLAFGIAALMVVTLFLFTGCAKAANVPPIPPKSYTCEDVRRVVAEIGRVRALALALKNGASWAQIREARRCLK